MVDDMRSLGKRLKGHLNAQTEGIYAELGRLNDDGSYTVRVEDTNNEVYARINGEKGNLVTAINLNVDMKARLPVRLRRNTSGRYEVLGVSSLEVDEFLGEGAGTANIPVLIGGMMKMILPGKNFEPGRVRSLNGTDLQIYIEEFPYGEIMLGGIIYDLTADVATLTADTKAHFVITVDTTNTADAIKGDEAGLALPLTKDDAFEVTVPAGQIALWSFILADTYTALPTKPLPADTIYEVDMRVMLRPGLTVKETDGAPAVSNVHTIVVSNGSLTDNGNGEVALTTGGGGGGMTDFTVAGDSGTPQTISNGNTLTISGGTGLSSVASATDTITINLDDVTTKLIFNEWTESGTPGADTLWYYAADDSGFTFPRMIDATGRITQFQRDIILVCKNNTGSTLNTGTAVRVFSVLSGVITIIEAGADTWSALAFGVVMDTVTTGNFTRVMIKGVMDYDTSGVSSAGVQLYLSTSTPGALTHTLPNITTGITQRIARALDKSASGHIYIDIRVDFNYAYTTSFAVGDGSNSEIVFRLSGFSGQFSWNPLTANRSVFLPDNSGVVILDTGTQVFSDGVVVNNSAGATGDFQVKGDTDTNLLFTDAGNDNIGIGTGTPNAAAKLEVVSTTKGSIPAPVMTVAQRDAIASPVEALQVFNGDDEELYVHDGQRFRGVGAVGWLPYALQPYMPTSGTITTANPTLPAVSGSLAIPITLSSHMLLEQVGFWCANATLQHTWGWDLYIQDLNNGNSGENTLRRVANSSADETFTATVASLRTITAASGPVYLPPGTYWLVLQNRHATTTFAMESIHTNDGFLNALNFAQTKTTGGTNGATLDFVAATWTKTFRWYAAVLQGRVFGQTTAY